MNVSLPRSRPTQDLKPSLDPLPKQEHGLKHMWRFAHWLSLDVALGAGLSAAWVNQSWQGEPSLAAMLAVASGALWVYSFDHWADARRLIQQPIETLSARRLYYTKHHRLLFSLGTISLGIGLVSAFQLPFMTVALGLGLTLICSLYLWLTQKFQVEKKRFHYPKEVMVTTVYALALSLWPLSQCFQGASAVNWLAGGLTSLLILLLAWANVCLISVHERKADASENLPSLALQLGEYTTRNVGRGLLRLSFLVLVVRAYVLFNQQSSSSLALSTDLFVSLSMSFTLWRLYFRPEWSRFQSRYRLWADAIFLYPALSLLFAWY